MSGNGNGDPSSKPMMTIDAIRFLRLLPPEKGAGPDYASGVALFLASMTHGEDCYLLTLSEHGSRRLAEDLNAFFEGRIDITTPGEDYGLPED